MDPKERAKAEMRDWLTSMVDSLNTQVGRQGCASLGTREGRAGRASGDVLAIGLRRLHSRLAAADALPLLPTTCAAWQIEEFEAEAEAAATLKKGKKPAPRVRAAGSKRQRRYTAGAACCWGLFSSTERPVAAAQHVNCGLCFPPVLTLGCGQHLMRSLALPLVPWCTGGAHGGEHRAAPPAHCAAGADPAPAGQRRHGRWVCSIECMLLCSGFGGFSSDRCGLLLLLAAGRLLKVSVDPKFDRAASATN